VTEQCGFTPSNTTKVYTMEEFSDQLSSSYQNLIGKLGEWVDMLILIIPNLIIASIVGVIAYFFSKYVRKFAVKAVSKVTKNRTILNLVANLTTVIFGVFILFIILSILNLGDTINKILATAGVLGLAVGLALQDPMTNLFSGVFMSVRKLYKIGDLVETNGYFGTITDIDLKATRLKLPTGQRVIIPNKDVIQKPLKNYSSSEERRVDLECGVSYGDDLDEVESIVREVMDNVDGLIEDKPIDFMFTEFGGSSINFKVRFWIPKTSQANFLKHRSEVIKAIKKSFDKNDISIPFPITTLDFGIRGGAELKEMLPKKTKASQNGIHKN